MSTDTLPTDHFSRRLRELSSNPGAVRASSTISTADFYGNAESWIVDGFRVDGKDEILIQRINAAGAVRIVLPAEVMSAIVRMRERAAKVNRRRGARQALETKRERGIDPAAALRAHRGGKRKGARS